MLRAIVLISLLISGFSLPAAAQGVFAGTWQVVAAQVAPWVKPDTTDKPAAEPKFAHAIFVFAKDRLSAPPPFNCRAHYEIKTVEPGYLFQGAFDQDDPEAHAKALGFKSNQITNLNFACLRNDADIEMDFHMADPDTVIFGLNDIVYTMKRQPPK